MAAGIEVLVNVATLAIIVDGFIVLCRGKFAFEGFLHLQAGATYKTNRQ